MQDKIADYVLGALDASQADALQEHVSECSGCRQYLQSLRSQSESLVELGREIGTGMTARQDRVIEALENAEPIARRAFPFVGGFAQDCCRGGAAARRRDHHRPMDGPAPG